MRDAEYWQSRCRRAEGLLAKARKGIRVSYQRAAVMRVLGDMKPGEWLSTARLTLLAGVKWSHLAEMRRWAWWFLALWRAATNLNGNWSTWCWCPLPMGSE